MKAYSYNHSGIVVTYRTNKNDTDNFIHRCKTVEGAMLNVIAILSELQNSGKGRLVKHSITVCSLNRDHTSTLLYDQCYSPTDKNYTNFYSWIDSSLNEAFEAAQLLMTIDEDKERYIEKDAMVVSIIDDEIKTVHTSWYDPATIISNGRKIRRDIKKTFVEAKPRAIVEFTLITEDEVNLYSWSKGFEKNKYQLSKLLRHASTHFKNTGLILPLVDTSYDRTKKFS